MGKESGERSVVVTRNARGRVLHEEVLCRRHLDEIRARLVFGVTIEPYTGALPCAECEPIEV